MNNEKFNLYIENVLSKQVLECTIKIVKKLFIIHSYKFYLKLQEKFKIVDTKNEYTLFIRKELNLKSVKCLCIGKGKYPSFNFQDQLSGICCKDCKSNEMIDVVKPRCRCGKSKPIYNSPGEIQAICCSKCKDEDMINIIDKRCKCGKHIPSFNLPNESRATRCSECKTEDMIEVKNKKCECGTRPTFNLPDKSRPTHCSKCKTAGMIDVVHNKCIKCSGRAYYNIHGKSAEYCYDHKTDIMIDNPTKQCAEKLCNKLAIYGINRPDFCEEHKNEHKNTLISTIKDKCSECNLYLLLNWNNLCFYCNNPDYRMKKHEVDIKYTFDYNNRGYKDNNGYTRYNKQIDGIHFPDFTFQPKTHFLFVEVDENQHKRYENDEKRMITISRAIKIPVIFIRYNPDNYVSFVDKNNVKDCDRKKILLEQLDIYYNIDVDRLPKLSALYLFYDKFDINNMKLITIER
jgi:hypothetical protein